MTVLETARAYVRAGLSVIPIRADGSKAPAVASWKEYQSRRPTDAELRRWFSGTGHGLAVIGGAVSGGLEVLDFDDPAAFDAWAALVEAQAPGLLGRLTRVRTPSGGVHVYYRCEAPGGNTKLAEAPDGPGKRTLIETRGEGGYVLAPGCPPGCHPSGGAYAHEAGRRLEDWGESS